MSTESSRSTQTPLLRTYPGGFFRVVVSPGQIEDNIAIIDMTAVPGSEAPRHVHSQEDELFHLIEGQVRFQIGDQALVAGPGQTVLAPRNIPHQFTILTQQARMLNLFTPGNFVNYILGWSQPINQEPVTLRAPQGPPPAEVMAQRTRQLAEQYGVYFT